MKRFLAKLEIAILQLCSGQTREERSWLAMMIEQKTCSIQQFAKTANCMLGDRTKNMFDSAVCKKGKLRTGHEIVSFLRFEQRFSGVVSFPMTPNMNIYEMD